MRRYSPPVPLHPGSRRCRLPMSRTTSGWKPWRSRLASTSPYGSPPVPKSNRAAANEGRGPRSETERRPTRNEARDRRQSGGRRGTGPEIGDRATTDLVVRLRTAGVSRSHGSLKKEDDCWWQRQLRGRSWVA